ncbi:MAG: hypothetical protein ACK5AZ_26695 [Bryobacteraceae bacterium]
MTEQDAEHLRLLSIFHYVTAVLIFFLALLPILHLVIGMQMILNPDQMAHGAPAPMAWMGWFFVLFASLWIVSGLALTVTLIAAAHFLRERRRRTFCMVVAAIACLFFPFGTILGAFTLIVLSRPAVAAAFDPPAPGYTSG